MKHLFSKLFLLSALFYVLSGCGQMGPLYMPDDTQDTSSPKEEPVPVEAEPVDTKTPQPL